MSGECLTHRARREAVTAVAAQMLRAKGARARGQRRAVEQRRCHCSKQADDQLDHQQEDRRVNRQGGTKNRKTSAIRRQDRSEEPKEHSQLQSGGSINKKVKHIPNCREQSGQEARTAKVCGRTLEVLRRTDETKRGPCEE